MKLTKMKFEKITGNIIGAAFKVYNKLGFGFKEKISWLSPKRYEFDSHIDRKTFTG